MRDPREEYWNEQYLRYWKQRVEEANLGRSEESALVQGDKVSSTDQNYINAVALLNIRPGDKVLELACGFGRILPHLHRLTSCIFCLDISKSMIEAAREANPGLEGIEYLTGTAESIPYPQEFFDHIICYASFDAFYQKEALIEMSRVLKSGGTVLFTGKNNNYFPDDKEAMTAEINARRKGEPNYFTNVRLLLSALDRFGYGLVLGRYFPRRGDIVKNHFRTNLPDNFYEYLLVLSKTQPAEADPDLSISSAYSETFLKLKNG
jgi:ubiquinone/menaquinone biosynthesis C-methylase UbiE